MRVTRLGEKTSSLGPRQDAGMEPQEEPSLEALEEPTLRLLRTLNYINNIIR